MALTPAQALQQLKTDPEAFLKRYTVRIWGDPDPSGSRCFRIHDGTASKRAERPGSVLGNLRRHATQQFHIKARGSIGPGAPAVTDPVWFDAHCVRAAPSDKPHEIGPYTLPAPGGGGESLMLTGELTGCAFAIHRNADGSLVVAHIRPHLAGSSPLHARPLQSMLEKTAFWHVVYGGKDYDYYRLSVSIVGRRMASGWQIYAQENLETIDSIGTRSVKRIL